MLTNSANSSKSDNGEKPPLHKSGWITALVIIVIGTLLGSILGLLLGIAHGSDALATAGAVGAMFGGVLGLIIGILFALIPGVRNRGSSSKFRMILFFALLGGVLGALSLFLFGNGFAMALYLAVEGAIAGSIIGALLGFSVTLLKRT